MDAERGVDRGYAWVILGGNSVYAYRHPYHPSRPEFNISASNVCIPFSFNMNYHNSLHPDEKCNCVIKFARHLYTCDNIHVHVWAGCQGHVCVPFEPGKRLLVIRQMFSLWVLQNAFCPKTQTITDLLYISKSFYLAKFFLVSVLDLLSLVDYIIR